MRLKNSPKHTEAGERRRTFTLDTAKDHGIIFISAYVHQISQISVFALPVGFSVRWESINCTPNANNYVENLEHFENI